MLQLSSASLGENIRLSCQILFQIKIARCSLLGGGGSSIPRVSANAQHHDRPDCVPYCVRCYGVSYFCCVLSVLYLAFVDHACHYSCTTYLQSYCFRCGYVRSQAHPPIRWTPHPFHHIHNRLQDHRLSVSMCISCYAVMYGVSLL